MPERIGEPIPVDIANEYITNHITKYFDSGAFPVKSLIFSAELLRNYLNDNPNIENMKFMLAVRPLLPGEISSPGYAGDAAANESISMVIVGYDAEGNYVKMPGNMVLDNAMPCPYNCPPDGSAGNDHII
jgi:hypothetical protein